MRFIVNILFIICVFSFGGNLSFSQEQINEREFSENLNEKYSGSDFQYEEEKPPPPEEKPSEVSKSVTKGFVYFISEIFPYILGLIVILIILKTFVGVDINFWSSTKNSKTEKEELVYEDEIDENDYEALLQRALRNKDFRSAIRYYYLSTLKLLADKKFIEFHKEKTNADYLFELKSDNLRQEFSNLSYIFSYVWYGEFSLDEFSFKIAEQKYQSFKSQLK